MDMPRVTGWCEVMTCPAPVMPVRSRLASDDPCVSDRLPAHEFETVEDLAVAALGDAETYREMLFVALTLVHDITSDRNRLRQRLRELRTA